MEDPVSPPLQQVHVGIGPHGYQPVASHEATDDTYVREHDEYQTRLLAQCPANLWRKGSYLRSCPRPILLSGRHQRKLEALHDALTTAITDIVDRWWTDQEARFPERMPLEPEEEDLLQVSTIFFRRPSYPTDTITLKWLEQQVQCGKHPRYAACRGSWRPDFLVEDGGDDNNPQGGGVGENFVITEINARFAFNGFMHQAYGQRALGDQRLEQNGLAHATDTDKVILEATTSTPCR